MKGMLAVVAFTALTAICWGVYGPVILEGQAAMGDSRLRPFVCVGVAYFLIAVLVPITLLRARGETGAWTTSGTIWSLLAGAAGALGALGIILAFSFKGKPIFVMPLVFGCAPVVNTFVTMYLSKTFKQVGPVFLAGLILVALGAVTVLAAKPAHSGAKITEQKDGGISIVRPGKTGEAESVEVKATSAEELEKNFPAEFAIYAKFKNSQMSFGDFVWVTIFIAMTAICWGAYGPVLHKGQMAMNGSRLRPLICVGLAYMVIAVAIPLALLGAIEPGKEFTTSGSLWSLLGGATGAIGALGIILAFNSGGKPIYVMPLVFGCAPVVNSFTEIVSRQLYDEIGPLFIAGLMIVIVGAVTVLVFAPKPGHKPVSEPATAPQ